MARKRVRERRFVRNEKAHPVLHECGKRVALLYATDTPSLVEGAWFVKAVSARMPGSASEWMTRYEDSDWQEIHCTKCGGVWRGRLDVLAGRLRRAKPGDRITLH